MLRMSLSLGFRQELSQRLTLSLDQRVILSLAMIERREEMLIALRGEEFRPKAKCIKCFKELTSADILKGFSSDPTDYLTTCPDCSYRFAPEFFSGSSISSMTIPFYCAVQTLDQLKHREVFSPEVWKTRFASVYNSAIYHFGSLAEAYAEIGIKYGFEEVPDWVDKIKPFLGRLPDTDIASFCGVKARQISKMRRDLYISKYVKTEDEALY